MESAFDSKKLLAMKLLCSEINIINHTGMPNFLPASYQGAAQCIMRYGSCKALRNYALISQDDTRSVSVPQFQGQGLRVLRISGKGES